MARTKRKYPKHEYVPIPPEEQLPKGIRVFTRAEADAQLDTINQLLTSLASTAQVVRICRERHNIGRARVFRLMERVRETWAQEDQHNRPAWKSAAMRRLNRWILAASGTQDENGNWTTKPDFAVLARFETLLADMQGTREPIKVNVDVRVSAACMNVIAGLSSEQADRYLSEYKENVRLAKAYKDNVVEMPQTTPKQLNGTGTDGRR